TTGETAKEGQSGGYKGTPGGLPSASLAHVSESDSSTTHSAVAAGDIIIRDPAKQQQNVAGLSRDTANAHKALDNNFDKEAIKDKLEIQQQATALGTQAMTVYMDSKLDAAKKQVRDDMAARGELNGLSDTEIESKITASPEFKAVDKEYGIGSPFWTASSAMTGLLAGVLGGNVQGGMAAGAAPVLAKLVKDAAGKNEAARVALHTVVSAALAKAQGGNATAGAIGGFIASAGAGRFAEALYGKTADELTPDEKMVVLNLVAAVSAAGGGIAAGDTGGMVSAGNAARVEVENNSLAGDKARESVIQSAEWWKTQVRNKLGENIASQLVNGLINASSETSDFVMLGGDTAFDLTAALATCATGGSYCGQAQSDLAKKDAGAAATLTAIMNGDAWEGIKSTTIKAANGDQKALESFAGVLSGALVSAKVLPSGGSSVNVAGKAESATVNAGKATSGAENAATYPKLKDDLVQQNLNNIAKQDPRLAAVVQGDNGKLNYGVGSSTKAEADRLGKIWVGDGARLTSDGSGLMSADKTRVYRFPASKDNSSHATTGTQANFETYKINPVTGDKTKIGNGHLDIN
ncbi:VENN motif pre-toxin domain-containing protein, partial [Vagococcus sp. WN89Y]|uniref:VENN motif pre-toxin domain-containing protein n=1 Tax=Vagococcus sp. WN89Y TaxID=3457258 RepID=UPI003FCC9C0F